MGTCLSTGKNSPNAVNVDKNKEDDKSHLIKSNSSSTNSQKDNVVAPQDIWTRLQPSPQVGDWLKNVPIFCRVPEDKRNKVGGVMETIVFKQGEDVFKQGDVGDRFYIIKQGTASVTVSVRVDGDRNSNDTDLSNPDTNPEHFIEKEVARLKQGDYFGETALLSKATRNATITACDGDLETLTLDSATFKKLFHGLNVQLAKRKGVTEVTKSNKVGDGETDEKEVKDIAKSEAEIGQIVDIFDSCVLFERLNNDQKVQIAQNCWKREYRPDEVIGKKGEILNNLHIVKKGTAIKIDERKANSDPELGELAEGQMIGEIGLMYNSPLQFTYKTSSERGTEFWVINRRKFREIVKDSSQKKLNEFEAFIKTVPVLATLLQDERKRIAEAFEEIYFDNEHIIVKQGDIGDTFYIVRKGTAVVTKYSDSDTEPKEVMQLGPGHFFGERALIKNDVRAATVTVTSPKGMQCLMLDREGFTLLLGPLGDLMKRKIATEYDGISISIGDQSGNDHSEPSLIASSHVAEFAGELNDLNVIGTLGKGSFGHVELCTPNDKDYYALKTVHKAHVIALGQQEHIINEKRVLVALTESPFVIKLWATFKDPESVYFLLEPVLGGELFALLRDRSAFDEITSAFYAACVVEAFDYMHSKHIIYRDLKPENLLLAQNGYLKITDFGFAKFVTNRTWTLCGTPDYLAPEVVSGIGHNKAVDWWTLGILIYEMISSYPPFYDDDPMQTYTRIMHGSIDYPRHFSKNVVDLIKRLLQPKPTKRIGVIKGGVDNIKNHPWFKKTARFDWNRFEALKLTAPYRPQIAGPHDLSNFQEYSETDDDMQIQDGLVVDDGSNWDQEF